jgi:hypothetical protein
MFLSSGSGYLVVPLWFGCAILIELLTRAVFQDYRYYEIHGWPKPLGFWIAAVIIWPMGRALNRRKQKEMSDPKTGVGGIMISEGHSITRHTFLFIPMEYWALFFFVVGIWAFFL